MEVISEELEKTKMFDNLFFESENQSVEVTSEDRKKMRDDRVFQNNVTFKVGYDVKMIDIRLQSIGYETQLISGFPMQFRDRKTNEVFEAIDSLYM